MLDWSYIASPQQFYPVVLCKHVTLLVVFFYHIVYIILYTLTLYCMKAKYPFHQNSFVIMVLPPNNDIVFNNFNITLILTSVFNNESYLQSLLRHITFGSVEDPSSLSRWAAWMLHSRLFPLINTQIIEQE